MPTHSATAEPMGTVCPKCGAVTNQNGYVMNYADNITEYIRQGFKRQLCDNCIKYSNGKEN